MRPSAGCVRGMKGSRVLAAACLAILLSQGIREADAAEDIGGCIESAAQMYSVSPALLWGIAKVESGFNPRAVNTNKNGSYDFGVMQINSSHARSLGLAGWLALGDPCYNVHVGAWVLAGCVARHGNTWEAVGCYNARSAPKRRAYAWRVYRALAQAGGGKE